MQTCPLCKQEKELKLETCDYCNFPFAIRDDKVKRSRFIAEQSRKKIKVKEVYLGIKLAKNLMYLMAAIDLSIAVGFIGLTKTIPEVVYPFLFFGLIMLFSAIFIYKNPVVFIALPLGSLTILYTLFYMHSDDIFWISKYLRMVFLLGLIYSLITVIISQKISKQSLYLGSDGIWDPKSQNKDDNLLDN